MRRHEHKAPINPAPDAEATTAAASFVWAPPTAANERRRVHIQLSDDEAVMIPTPSTEKLTPEQHARRNNEYTTNDIGEIEYAVSGDAMEHIGYGEVVRMAPIPMATRSGTPAFRTMRIRWIYECEDLMAEDSISPDAFEKLDFEDGDMAFSNHQQDVNVYNVVRVRNEMRDTVEFYYDGRSLRPASQRGAVIHDEQDEEEQNHEEDGEKDSNDEGPSSMDIDESDDEEMIIPRRRGLVPSSAAASEPADESLPRHLFIVKEFLFSNKVWSDTKYGADWWFTLNSLLSMGHSSTNTRARSILEEMFFDTPEENREPVLCEVSWDRIVPAERVKCDACGIKRMVTWSWEETGWSVGKTCKERIDTLHTTCAFMFNARTEAMASKPHLPLRWLEKVTKKLNRLRNDCMLAIAGEHGV